jgi:cytoskeletal protein CcmA (bactofilin family)
MFGKKAGNPQNHIDSLIGAGTRIEGSIHFSGGLRVDGHVCGNIIATSDKASTLVLSDQAVVEGKIEVSHAIVNGTVMGAIYVSEYVELQPKARVIGDIHYRSMEIQLGASIDGMLHHHDANQPQNKVISLIPAAHSE